MIIINQGWLLKSPPEEKMRGRFFKSVGTKPYSFSFVDVLLMFVLRMTLYKPF